MACAALTSSRAVICIGSALCGAAFGCRNPLPAASCALLIKRTAICTCFAITLYAVLSDLVRGTRESLLW
eukprot:2723274-Rhodomonas_salina.5